MRFVRTVLQGFTFLLTLLRNLLRFLLRFPKALFHWLRGIACALWQLWCALGPKPLRITFVVIAVLAAGYMWLSHFLAPKLTEERIYEVHYLNEGWSDAQRALYYYTPQGTELLGLNYDWFVNLELPLSHNLLASEDNLRGWGFIVDPAQQASKLNSGNLAVGMSKHIDPINGAEKLDLGCAVCHTGELHYNGHALRIDGGQALQSIATAKRGEFITTLGASVVETLINPAKWDRFADRVAGQESDARDALKSELWDFFHRLKTFITGAGAAKWYPVEEGRGRTDAVGRIANIVFGYDLQEPDNYRVADAPASYPFLWDIWRFDWVQYTGFTNQAMARNVGESLGVLAPIKLVDDDGKLLTGKDFGETLIDLDGMHCVEGLLRELKPPKWPESILGKIDIEQATEGKHLFLQECASCHGPHQSKRYDWVVADGPNQNPAKQVDVNWQWDMAGQTIEKNGQHYRPDQRDTLWAVPWVSVEDIGTDAKLAKNYMEHRYSAEKIIPGSEPVNAGDGLQVLLNRLVPTLYERWGIPSDEIYDYDGLNVPFRIANVEAYKVRPLHGVWATPPFLHNGSVPTIYHLLSPMSERPDTFYVGNRQYNPKLLGYETDIAKGAFLHDTHIDGNRNTGHLFTNLDVPGRIGRQFSEAEKMALLEYIKVMGNPDFSDALGGDPLNWDHYLPAPADDSTQQACRAVHNPSRKIASE